jgi:hypothetical protein
LATENQNVNKRISKEDKNPKEDRKKRPEMCVEEKPAGTAWERTTTISQNSRMTLQTKAHKIKPMQNHKPGYDPGISKEPGSGNTPVYCRHFSIEIS